MRTAALHNLGCKVNACETESMRQQLSAAGYDIVEFGEKADVYVINTCSVTNIADRKSRQMIRQARGRNPKAVVVAAGCFVQACFEGRTNLPDDWKSLADIWLGNNEKGCLVESLDAWFDGKAEDHVADLSKPCEYEQLPLAGSEEHTRVFIKIQDGCNQFCSYCLIPYVRGRIRSRVPEEILKEAALVASKGFCEIVLTGIHLTSYGKDLDNGWDLGKLIAALDKVEGVRRIRIGSLEPRIITEEFLNQIRDLKSICPHFHLSLQSGCDSVLKRMNRHYSCDEYEEKCRMLRDTFDKPSITTDVIVGFPGETQEEFEQTREYLEKIKLYETHIFKYSRRKGTVADKMSGQLTDAVKQKRSHVLIEIGARNSKAFREGEIGSVQELLLEETILLNGKEYWTGFDRQYVRIAVPAEVLKEAHSGMLIDVHVDGFVDEEIMLGAPCI